MFRHKRHIHARSNEWFHVHRHRRQNTDLDIPKIVGVSIGCLILAALIWELIKATYPFLIAAGVIAVVVHFVRKSS